MTDAVFVYGLLKPGQRLHHLVAPFVVRQARARVRGRLYDAGVPAARFDQEGTVEGFVLWLDPARGEEALALLDEVEEEGEAYRRVVVGASTEEGVVQAYAYEYLGSLEGCRALGPWW